MQSAIIEDMKKRIIHVYVSEGDDGYFVASSTNPNMVTQGKSLDELAHNIQEAVSLAVEGEDLEEMGYIDNPSVLVSIEFPAVHA